MILIPVGQSAQARPGELTPVVDPTIGPATDIVFTSLGFGTTITGLYPPEPVAQDPAAPYPESNPAGFTSITTYAGTLNTASVSDPTLTAEMYCINLRVQTQTGVGYQSGTWEESNVPNIGYVTRILNNYYPTTEEPTGLTPEERGAAVQAAIWYFTDGYVVSTSSPTVRAAAAAIVAATQSAGPVVEPPPPDVSITPPTTSAPVGTPAGPFVVAAENAAEVTVSALDGYTMFSDAAGTIPIANPSTVPSGTQIWVRGTTATSEEVVLRARAAVTVQRGQVYLYDGETPGLDDAQRLILADTAELDASAEASAAFFAVGGLTVDKTFAGEAAGQQGPIQLVVDCGEGYVFTEDIAAGTDTTQTFTYADIPVGSTCVVTEPTTGATTAVAVTTDAPQQAVITEDEAAVTITNTVTYLPGALNVVKTITGTGAGAQGEIILSVVCGDVLDETIVIPAGSAAGDYAQPYTDLPAGTICTVTEEQTGATSAVEVSGGEPVTVTIAPGATVGALVTNTVTPVPPAPPITPERPQPHTGGLPATGADAPVPALFAGGGALAAGLALLAAASYLRRRQSAAQ